MPPDSFQASAPGQADGDPQQEKERLRRAKTLIAEAEPQRALDVLGTISASLARDQLTALAHGKLGNRARAIRTLQELRTQGHRDGETLGILGGVYKELWLQGGNAADLTTSYQIYKEAYEAEKAATGVRDAGYPGINAAGMALLRGDEAESTAIAGEIRSALFEAAGGENPLNQWDMATLAEAALLLGQIDESRDWYARAVATDPLAVRNVGVMRRQARLELEKLGEEPDALDDVLRVPRVVAVAAHPLGTGGARPDRALLETLHREVTRRLQAYGAGFGFLVFGGFADLVFGEVMVDRGARVRAYVPTGEGAVPAALQRGPWRGRSGRFLEQADRFDFVLDGVTDPDELRDEARWEMQAAAERFAGVVDEDPVLLVIKGPAGEPSPAVGDAVTEWVSQGLQVETLDLGEASRAPAVIERPPSTPATGDNPVTRDIMGEIAAPEEDGPVDYARKHLLAIGVDGYNRGWPPLQNALADAEGVVEVLQRRFGFEPTLIKDADATRSAIRGEMMDGLRKRASEDDLVMVFFAGHGHTFQMEGRRKRGYIVPVDAPAARPGEFESLVDLISMDELIEWTDFLPSRHVLYVFDSCFSGMVAERGGQRAFQRSMLKRNARLAITAGGGDQTVADAGGEGHSVFTHLLLKALEGQLFTTDDGVFSATRLFAELSPRVSELSPIPQTPAMGVMEGHGGGDVLFVPAS